MIRCRATYAKKEELRYTSNLDMQKIWERYLRRAKLPLAYSQGFHPQPRIHQAAPLPLGLLSYQEIVDFWLHLEENQLLEIIAALTVNVQPGISITSIESIPSNSPAIQTLVRSSDYCAVALNNPINEELTHQVERINSASSLPRVRRNKPYDLRPLIQNLHFDVPIADLPPTIQMRLSSMDGATGRVDEVIFEMGMEPADFRITRTALIIDDLT